MRLRHFTLTILLCLHPLTAQDVKLERLGTFATNTFEAGGAEIAAFDSRSKRLFVVNLDGRGIDVLSLADIKAPQLLFRMRIPSEYGRSPNSVAARDGIVAVAVEAEKKTDPGYAVFFDSDGNFLKAVQVGALPDMITWTPDGTKVLTANEGEPSDDYKIDPEGSVSIIDFSRGVSALTQQDVTTAGFGAFGGALDPSIRIYGPNATVAQDMEPEYIAVSPDSRTAWVTLQENNAIGVLDLTEKRFTRLVGLGFKDHSKPGSGIDASDRDQKIDIRNWPVFGIYEPDAITTFRTGGRTYLITANEGDTREYSAFGEERRVSALRLDPTAFPNAAELQRPEQLGRLTVTRTLGDIDNDGDYDRLYVPGARSFTIWSDSGVLVYDSGDELEKRIAELYPKDFNSTNNENGSFDTRSDNKGPEPEGVVTAALNGRVFAFIGLERIGGVLVYDVTDPTKPKYAGQANDRKFDGNARAGTAGDLGIEGLAFIPASDSPTRENLLVSANEISGTTTIYRVTAPAAAVQANINADRSTVSQQVEVDGTASLGSGLKYAWRSIGKAAALSPSSPGKAIVQFTEGFGEYELELTVTDAAGATSTATVKILYLGR